MLQCHPSIHEPVKTAMKHLRYAHSITTTLVAYSQIHRQHVRHFSTTSGIACHHMCVLVCHSGGCRCLARCRCGRGGESGRGDTDCGGADHHIQVQGLKNGGRSLNSPSMPTCMYVCILHVYMYMYSTFTCTCVLLASIAQTLANM